MKATCHAVVSSRAFHVPVDTSSRSAAGRHATCVQVECVLASLAPLTSARVTAS